MCVYETFILVLEANLEVDLLMPRGRLLPGRYPCVPIKARTPSFGLQELFESALPPPVLEYI